MKKVHIAVNLCCFMYLFVIIRNRSFLFVSFADEIDTKKILVKIVRFAKSNLQRPGKPRNIVLKSVLEKPSDRGRRKER